MTTQGPSGAPIAASQTKLWKDLRDLDKVAYSASYARLTGSVAGGVLLAQIIYWSKPDKEGKTKLRVKKRGELWIAKSREEWEKETGLTVRQVKSAQDRLACLDLIEKDRFLFAGKVAVHVRLNLETVAARLAALTDVKPGGKDS